MQETPFWKRLLSRKLLVTLGAILAALTSGANTTHTIIAAVVAAVYVLAEAGLDASNKRDVIGDFQRGVDLAKSAQETAAPPPVVINNVTSIPPPPEAPSSSTPPVDERPSARATPVPGEPS